MICKNCQKQMPDVGDFCPFCAAPKNADAPQESAEAAILEEAVSREVPVEKPQKKKKWPLILGIVGGSIVLLALIALLTGFILNSLGVWDKIFPTEEPTAATEAPAASTDDETILAKADDVVAKVGNIELTNGELQLYYQNEIYNFYSQNYYYISYMGLDFSQPLDQQECMLEEGKTWQEYFLQRSLSSWEQYALLCLLAESESFQLDTEMQTQLDGLSAEIESYALQNGYDDVAAFIDTTYGINVDMDDYLSFNEQLFVANGYFSHIYDTRYPTAEEIEAYFVENEATFTEQSITRDMGLQSSVRHILIAPELEEATEEAAEEATEEAAGETTGEATEETLSPQEQEAWDAALQEAQTLLDTWKAGEATEDSFIALVADNTDDTASVESGGLYEDINADASYVPEFLNWAIDASRQPGDTEIVKTDYGYHIMYFVSGEDYWAIVVGEQAMAQRIQEMLEQAKETYPAEYHNALICLAPIDFG